VRERRVVTSWDAAGVKVHAASVTFCLFDALLFDVRLLSISLGCHGDVLAYGHRQCAADQAGHTGQDHYVSRVAAAANTWTAAPMARWVSSTVLCRTGGSGVKNDWATGAFCLGKCGQ
jgi:hypothetical protein